ncbi:MAG: aminotransferase class I/II-fold pyridoxal phosphate-dependent enzyme [Deltaproteobacteria bacterium]
MADVFDKAYDWKEARVARVAGYYPFFKAIAENSGTEVVIDGRKTIMVGANSYLSLSTHPKVKAAALAAVERYGASCCGSRFANGTLEIHEELERRLAKYLRKEQALCFTTGFTTNLGTISAMLGRHDIAISDRGNHASLMDGLQLTFAGSIKYKHNDMADLEKKLEVADKDAGKLLITDGVFSMEGDLADLPGIIALKKKYGFRVMVDDAHGLGVLGEGGRGTGEHFGLHDDVDLIMGTFSKSFGSIGGVIAGERDVIDWVKHRARTMIFAASMSPANVAAALAALDIIEAEPERRLRLWQVADRMRKAFQDMGFNTGVSCTPIIPILVGEQMKTFNLWKSLLEAGVFTNAVIPPAVEPGRSMLRTSYQAAHTEAQLDQVLDAFETIGKKLGLIERKRPTTLLPITHTLRQPAAELPRIPVAARPEGVSNGHRSPMPAGFPARLPARIKDIKGRIDAAWSLTGLPSFDLDFDLDRLQRTGQATLEKVRDAMEQVTFRAVSFDPTALTDVPKKLLSRVRRNGAGR